jgi:hypothetical protein
MPEVHRQDVLQGEQILYRRDSSLLRVERLGYA